MKSFGKSSFAGDDKKTIAEAAAAVDPDPTALFTDFQWFLYEGRDTVFYSAFSKNSFTQQALKDGLAGMVDLAPQLTLGYRGASPGEPLANHVVEAITSLEEVDSLDDYPDAWLSKSTDIFDHPDLPLFRVMVANRRNGPDEQGRASVIQVRASHAVLEGSDSALMTRSQSASHGVMSDARNKLGLGRRLTGALRGGAMSLAYIALGNLLAASEKPWGFKTLALKRQRLRILAKALNVRQRALMFALVTFALNGTGPKRHLSPKAIVAAYTMLSGERNDADDDFFRVRTLLAKFPVKDDFVDYVRGIDQIVDAMERKDVTKFQVVINSMFHTLRGLNRLSKHLPGKRFWRFSGGGHIVLTMVPPHRAYGDLTNGVIEPIYCGAWHSAANICTFCPGREYITLNFSMEQRHIANVDAITALLGDLEAKHVSASRSAAVTASHSAEVP